MTEKKELLIQKIKDSDEDIVAPLLAALQQLALTPEEMEMVYDYINNTYNYKNKMA